MIIKMYGYNNILQDAKAFYTNCAEGKQDEAGKCLDNYFAKAKLPAVNPSNARMALQQAQTDVYARLRIDCAEGTISPAEFKTAYKNMMLGTFQLNHDPALTELDNRIKAEYPKTWKKRLSIIPGLTDNEFLGLSCAKEAKTKRLKIIQYSLRKFFK